MDVREKTANEKRLIDSNKIINDIGLYMAENSYLNDTPLDILKMVADWIKCSQTVDAVEVVHGRWEEMHYEGGILDGTNFGRCSVCGYERVFDDPALKTVFKYCPNCGAKMDGGAE